jgi:hypothetical protein
VARCRPFCDCRPFTHDSICADSVTAHFRDRRVRRHP